MDNTKVKYKPQKLNFLRNPTRKARQELGMADELKVNRHLEELKMKTLH
jgi:hypothetical protein